MHTLFTSIKAIRQQPSSVSISKQLTQNKDYLDDGIEIKEQQTTYYFNNGVVICQRIEQDNAPSTHLCAECWISYEVIESEQLAITPFRKTFTNPCQQNFWLKMQQALENS